MPNRALASLHAHTSGSFADPFGDLRWLGSLAFWLQGVVTPRHRVGGSGDSVGHWQFRERAPASVPLIAANEVFAKQLAAAQGGGQRMEQRQGAATGGGAL